MAGKVGVGGVTFKQLWDSYPTGHPCTGPFSDQCAIKFTEALMANGLSISSFKGTRCWGDSSAFAGKHAIRAEEVANWLAGLPIPGMGKREKIDPTKYQSELDGRTGFIFYKDYWQRDGESFKNRSGDHIDLWNKNRSTGEMFAWQRGLSEWLSSDVSDRNQAKDVWFWQVD